MQPDQTPHRRFALRRAIASEFLGTAVLLVAIVGSGITASAADDGINLLHHALAVGLVLAVLISVLAPISGAHFNPAVTAVAWLQGRLPRAAATAFIAAQLSGAVAGVVAANLVFDQPVLAISDVQRGGMLAAGSEFIATLGLLLVILAAARTQPRLAPFVIGAYITAAILFTPTAAFANPAATIARTLTGTPTGIAPAALVAFLLGQVAAASAALWTANLLFPDHTKPEALVLLQERELASGNTRLEEASE